MATTTGPFLMVRMATTRPFSASRGAGGEDGDNLLELIKIFTTKKNRISNVSKRAGAFASKFTSQPNK